MENVESDSPTDYAGKKRNIIIIAAVLFILNAPLSLIMGEQSPQSKLINFLILITLNILVFAWIYYDGVERNRPLGVAWRFLVIFFGIFALLIYLLKSRGFKKGSIAVGKALLIIAAILLTATVAVVIVSIILEAFSPHSVLQ